MDGNDFNNFEGFYNEVDSILTRNLDFKSGHNLAAFNDLLRGGFGVHEYEEPIVIKWINYKKSIKELEIKRIMN